MKKIIFMLIMVVGLMITGCGSKEEEIKETVDSTVKEEIQVSNEYLEELEYNSQKNSWGN